MARRPADGVTRRPPAVPMDSRSPSRRPTTGRSCTCARRSSRSTTWSRWPSCCSARSSRSRSRRGVTGTTHPEVQPALLRARHGVPAARDAQPDQLQPAVRHDLAGQRAGLLRDPDAACCWPSSSTRAGRSDARRRSTSLLFVSIARGLPAAARIAPASTRRGCATPSPRSSPSRRSSSPTSCSLLVPRHEHGGHGLRQQPAGGDGRRRAGVPRADHRLPGAAAGGGRLYGLAWLFATRFRLGADRELATRPAPTTVPAESVAPHRRSLPPEPALALIGCRPLGASDQDALGLE